MFNDEKIEKLRIFAEITGDHDQVPVAGRMMHQLADAIDQLRKQRDAARLQGFEAAREMAANLSDNLPARWDGNVGLMLTKELSSSIRAMQPPDERGNIGIPISTQEQPWPHPDGFAGGLTEKGE